MNGFEKNIREQGEVLGRLSATYWGAKVDELAILRAYAKDDEPVLLTGMGGSLAAAEFAVPILRAAGRSAVAIDASELTEQISSSFSARTLVIAISQGGQSRETLDAVTVLKRAGIRNTVAITNDMDSPLSQSAALSLPMMAGDEHWAAAKSFTASQLILGFITEALSPSDMNAHRQPDDARIAAQFLDDLIRNSLAEEAARRLGPAPYLAVLARGSSMSSAKYAALLFKESAAMPCEAITTSDFGHGPVELTTLPIGVILLSAGSATHDRDLALAGRLSKQGVPTWLLCDEAVCSLHRDPDAPLITELRGVSSHLVPIGFSVELQLFAAAISRLRGREPGVFTTFSRADVGQAR